MSGRGRGGEGVVKVGPNIHHSHVTPLYLFLIIQHMQMSVGLAKA